MPVVRPSLVMRTWLRVAQPRLLSPAVTLPTLQTRSNERSFSKQTVRLSNNEENRQFMTIFPDLVRELTFEGEHKDMPIINKHLSKCIQYNVPTGKKNRGLMVASTYKVLVSEEQLTEENIRLVNTLGWCVEFLQAFFLVADDIMDGSDTRRGQEAWYKKDKIGLIAFNDAIVIEACVYAILEKHFKDKPYYLSLLEEFHKTTQHTAMGQSLDLLTSVMKSDDGVSNLEEFDMKRYSSIVKYKTSYYSFYLPIALAMRMAGIENPAVYRQAQTILLEMGHFFQVQDDYLDCFGDPKVTGKIGTDIQDGKCSWLIVVAMQRASKEQKEILKSCYGHEDPEKVAKVKEIYEELKLRKVYKSFEEESYADINMHISQVPGEGKILPPKLFKNFLQRIYKRNQ